MNDAELGARAVPVPNTGVDVHNVTFEEAVELIVGWARDGSGGYVSTPNVDHLVRARRDPAFLDLVRGARLRLPDGMGLIYGMRLGGHRLRGAVHGRLLPEAFVRATAPDSPALAMIGGRDDAPQRANTLTGFIRDGSSCPRGRKEVRPAGTPSRSSFSRTA